MIIGIGVDMIETERVEAKISKEGGFREHVFAASEITYCEKQANKSEHYAARFAAKESLLKAMGTGLPGGVILNEVAVTHDEGGRPVFTFHGSTEKLMEAKKYSAIHLSVSHLKNIACAMVVIEK